MTEVDVTPIDSLATNVALSDTSPDFLKSCNYEADVTPRSSMSREVQQNEAVFQLLAENCCLKLILCKNRVEQQGIISNYAIRFSQLNYDPKRHARAYLEAEMEKHGVSHRTLLRMLPIHLKDYSKRMNRLGKMKSEEQPTAMATEEMGAAGCYVEPD